MRRVFAKLIMISILFVGSQSWACSRPDLPDLPVNGAVDPGTMMQAKVAVSKYITAQRSYLKDCVISTKVHNKIVLEMRSVANHFNDLLHQFDDYQMQRFAVDD